MNERYERLWKVTDGEAEGLVAVKAEAVEAPETAVGSNSLQADYSLSFNSFSKQNITMGAVLQQCFVGGWSSCSSGYFRMYF